MPDRVGRFEASGSGSGPAAWSKSRKVRAWGALAVLAGGAVGGGVAVTQQPSINHPVRVNRVVLPLLPGANGTLTDSQCRAVPDGATFAQVLQTYGWPQRVINAQRNGFSSQETDGVELDYPVRASLHTKFVRFCAIVFGTRRGTVNHKWEDLP